MASEEAVKQLLSEEFTVQIEIEGNKIYASKYNTRVKTWTIALRVNKKIRNQENKSKPSNNASAIKNEAEEADDKDVEDGGVIDIDTQDIVLTDGERLEKSRELHRLNIKMANLSNHIDIFGFEKIEEHKKFSQKSRLLYKDLVVDGKRRLKLGETLPEPIGQISEQMQNTMGYNNAPIKQLKSIEEKYTKAKKVIDDAKVNLGNLWTHVMHLEKSLSGSALKEFKKTKNKMGIDFFRDKGQISQLAAIKEMKKDGEAGPVVKQEVKEKNQRKGNNATKDRRPTDDRYNDHNPSRSRDTGKNDQKRKSDENSRKSSSGRNENWKNDRRTRERDSRSRSPVTKGRKRSYDSTEKISVIDYGHKLEEKSGGPQRGQGKGREQQRRNSASAASSNDGMSGGNDWGKFLENVFGQENQGIAAANQGKSQSGRPGERIRPAAMDRDEAGRRMAASFTDRKQSSAAAPLFPIHQQTVGTSSNQSGPMDKSKGPIPDDPAKWLSDYYRATQQTLTDRSERKPSEAANPLPGNPQQPTQQQLYQQMLLDKKFLQERLLQQKGQSAPSQQQLPMETEQARQPSSQDVQKSKDVQKSQQQLKDEPKLQLVSYDMEDDGSEEEQHNRRKSQERSRSSDRNRKRRSARSRSRSRSRHGRRSRSRGRNRSHSRDRSEERKKARIVAQRIENRHKKTSPWQAQPKKPSPWQAQPKKLSPWQAQLKQHERDQERKQRLEEVQKRKETDREREQRKQEKKEREECVEKLLREKRERERKVEEEIEERRKKVQEKIQKIDKTALGLGRKRDRIKVVSESKEDEDDQNQPKVDYIVAQKVTAKPKVQAAQITPRTVASTQQKTSELAAKLGISEDMAIKALQVHGNLGADIGLTTKNRAANPMPTQGQFPASQTLLADKGGALPAASPSIPSQSYRHPIMSGNQQILSQLPASHSQTAVGQSPQFSVSMASQSSNQRMSAGNPMTAGSAPLGLAHSASQGMALANPQIGHVTAAAHTNNPATMERQSQIPGGLYGAPLRAATAEVTPFPEAPQMPAMAAAPSAAALSKLNAIEAVLNEKMRRLQELQTKNSYPAAVNPEAGHSTASGLQDMSAAVSQATSTSYGQAMLPVTAGQTSNIPGVMPSAAGQSSHMPGIRSAAAGQTADNESLLRAYKDRLLGLGYTGMPQNPDPYL